MVIQSALTLRDLTNVTANLDLKEMAKNAYQLVRKLAKAFCIIKLRFKNLLNTRECFNTFLNTEERVENSTRSGGLLTNFKVFENVMKRSLECFIYLLNRNQYYREN